MARSTRGRRFPPAPLSMADAARLIAACPADWRGRRNAALLALLYRGGARLAEALGVDVPDVRRVPGGVIVRLRAVKGRARGAPPRDVGLDPKAAALLGAWLEVRSSLWGRLAPMGAVRTGGPVFCTASGRRMLPSQVRDWLPRLAQAAGVQGRVHAHGLRHTFAREFYEETGDLLRTSRALGHRNVATTDGYLRSIGVTQAAEANMRREW